MKFNENAVRDMAKITSNDQKQFCVIPVRSSSCLTMVGIGSGGIWNSLAVCQMAERKTSTIIDVDFNLAVNLESMSL